MPVCCRPERGHFAEEYPEAHANIAELETERDALQARVEEAERQYCNPCRSAGETPLSKAVYICYWCDDGFCHEHAAKHFGAERDGRNDLTEERDRYKALAEQRKERLDAVQTYVDKLAKGHVSGTWQGLVKRDVERILWPAAIEEGK
jgi:hypothetical protein